MLRCGARTAVKSDEGDEQGNHVMDRSDTSQGIMGCGNRRAGSARIHIWNGDDLQHGGLMMDESTDRWMYRWTNGRSVNG